MGCLCRHIGGSCDFCKPKPKRKYQVVFARKEWVIVQKRDGVDYYWSIEGWDNAFGNAIDYTTKEKAEKIIERYGLCSNCCKAVPINVEYQKVK